MYFAGFVPIDHAEIEVIPRGSVNDAAVGRDAAGLHVAYRLVTVIQRGFRKLCRHTVHPLQRTRRPVFTRPSYPGACRGDLRHLRKTRKIGRHLQTKIVTIGSHHHTTVVAGDYQFTGIADTHRLEQTEQAVRIGAQSRPCTGRHVDNNGMLVDIALLVIRRIKTAGIVSARRHGRAVLKLRMTAVTRENMVFGQLHHCDGLLGRTGPHGYLRLARVGRIVVGDRNGERGGRDLGHLYPRGQRLGLPFRRVGMHLNGQGAVPLAPKGAGSIAQPHVLRFGHALGFTACQQQGRTHEG